MYTFFLDIDGTIFDGNTVSENLIETIRRAQKDGHKFFINTAREYHNMPQIVKSMPMDGFVATYGQTVFCEGDYIKRTYLPMEDVVKVAEYAFANNCKVDFIGEDIRLQINNDMERSIILKSPDELVNKYKNAKIGKITIFEHTEKDAAFLGELFDVVPCGKLYVEGILKGSKKRNGMEFVEKYYNLPHEGIVAMGDNMPDWDMLEYASYGVAMGNGVAKLKDLAKYITKSITEDGVSYAIECIINGEADKLLER